MGHDAYFYQSEQMPQTPGSRHVIKIVGDHSTIRIRGNDIVELGEKMQAASRTLELFADGTVGKGESFKAVREQAQAVHEDLSIAAARYKPSGSALVTYANALQNVQDSTDSLVVNAASAWAEVNGASHALSTAEGEQREFDFNDSHDVDQTGARPSSAAEQSSFSDALTTFEGYWGQYDAPVATWEAAYDHAVTKLEKTNDDGVSDGFWDNAMPFIEGLLTVLAWVGIALFIIAFFVTGPLALIAGAIAAALAVISLLGEIAKLANGRGSWADVGLAAFGVLPFGKLAKLGEIVGEGSKLTKTLRFTFAEFGDLRSGMHAFDNMLAARLPGAFTTHGMNTRNLFRVIYGPSMTMEALQFTGSWGNSLRNLAGFAPGTLPQTLSQGFAGSLAAIQQFAGLGVNIKSV